MESPKLPVAYNLIALDEVGSTNEEAKHFARKGEQEYPDGTLIWAQKQIKDGVDLAVIGLVHLATFIHP